MKKVCTLDNGVRVAIIPFQGAIDVGIGVALDAGSAYETKAYNGISHLLEHILGFHHSRFDSMEERGKAFDDCTTRSTAETDQRVMRFGYETKAKHFRTALALARDTLLRPRINRTTISHELRRIREEEFLRTDDPETQLMDKTLATLNQGTNGSLPILGILDNLNDLRIRDYVDWYRQFAVGQRCAVAITGSIRPESAERVVRQAFVGMRTGTPAPPLPQPRIRSRIHVTRRQSKTVYVTLSFPVSFGFAHPDRLPVTVLRNHLHGRESSLLGLQLITQTGLVYGVECSIRHTEGSGYVMINWSVHQSVLLETLSIVLETTSALAAGAFSAEHLRRATTALKASARERNYDPYTQAMFYAEQLLLTGDVLTTDQFIRALRTLRVRDVRRVAARVFAPNRALLTLVGPVSKSLVRDARRLLTAERP